MQAYGQTSDLFYAGFSDTFAEVDKVRGIEGRPVLEVRLRGEV